MSLSLLLVIIQKAIDLFSALFGTYTNTYIKMSTILT